MTNDLADELQEIDGVGPATAEEICDVVNGYEFTYPPYIQKAMDAADSGDFRMAGIYLNRAGGE